MELLIRTRSESLLRIRQQFGLKDGRKDKILNEKSEVAMTGNHLQIDLKRIT